MKDESNNHKVYKKIDENHKHKIGKSISLYLKDAKWSIIIVLVWFGIGFLYYSIKYPGNIALIILNTFYLIDPNEQDVFGAFYILIGSVIISQGVFAFIVSRMLEKTNPVLVCREIAKDVSNPVVVFHYGHIGSRIVDYVKSLHLKYVIVEEEEVLVKHLLENGEPVVVGDPTSDEILDMIDIKNSKHIFVCTNNTEQSLILSNKIRKINENCNMYVRIFEDRLQKILEQPPYNAKCFSTSQGTIEKMKQDWVFKVGGKAIVIGISNFTIRLIEEFRKNKRKIIVLDEDEDKIDYFKGTEVKAFEGDATQMDYLESSDVSLKDATQVFIDLEDNISDAIAISSNIKMRYPNISVYVRLFDDDLGEFLERLSIETFSTSKFMFGLLKKSILYKLNDDRD